MKGQTHREPNGSYYAVIALRSGHSYLTGPFKSRQSAWRYSVKKSNRGE